MKVQITIKTDNAAFGEDGEGMTAEISRILEKLAKRIKDDIYFIDYLPLMDVNGNKVGEYRVE